MNKLETNVLILGKSGVGKSSFINYIYGKDIRDKGVGKPVTEQGLHEVRYEMDNLIVNLSDSWGLEANKTNNWKDIVLNEVKKHNEKFSIKDWYHTIYYCFSASTARIEEFEIEDILKPLIKEGNRVTLILTHCDVKGADEKIKGMVEKLVSALDISESDIIKVCSERKKLLGGKVKEPFGKEEVLYKLKSNLWSDIKTRIPKQYAKFVECEIRKWGKISAYKIEENLSGLQFTNSSLASLIKEIDNHLKQISLDIKEETQKNIYEAFIYYSSLVRIIYKTKFNINNDSILDDFKYNIDKKMIKNHVILNFVKDQLFIFLPVLAPVGLIVSKLSQSHVKNKLIKDISIQADELVSNIPEMKENLEKYLDSFDNEQMLLSDGTL